MAARLSALRAGRFLPPGRFLVLISVGGWVDPRVIVRLEGLGKLKKSTSSGTRTGDLPACSIVPPKDETYNDQNDDGEKLISGHNQSKFMMTIFTQHVRLVCWVQKTYYAFFVREELPLRRSWFSSGIAGCSLMKSINGIPSYEEIDPVHFHGRNPSAPHEVIYFIYPRIY
jgi:hypothetical protein